MNLRNVLFVMAGVTTIPGCTYLHSSSTPKGVDVSPLFSIKIENFNHFPEVERNIAGITGGFGYQKSPGATAMVFSSPKIVSKTYDVFRHIELWQSQTSDGASAKYLSYKTLFTDKSDDWRLYKEDGVAHNKYFISYKTARWDSNHGIPTHVYSYPEIIVGMVKQNLFIVISYTGYRDGLDYVHDINEDIVYVRDLLQTSIFPINAQSEAVPNPSGR